MEGKVEMKVEAILEVEVKVEVISQSGQSSARAVVSQGSRQPGQSSVSQGSRQSGQAAREGVRAPMPSWAVRSSGGEAPYRTAH